jgi:hypothetical protein
MDDIVEKDLSYSIVKAAYEVFMSLVLVLQKIFMKKP